MRSGARRIGVTVVLALFLAGCAAVTTSIEKRDLDVQVKMSDTIFLDPLPPQARTVYVEVRNSSDRPDFELAAAVRQSLAARGFRVVEDPDAANIILQANVLQVGRSAQSAADEALAGGFGSAIEGAVIGGAVGYGLGKAGGHDALLTIGGAIAGAAVSTVANAAVQDVTYTVITDVQISERVRDGELVSQSETQNIPQGSAGTVTQSRSTTTEWRRYRTRIVGTANKANLTYEEAAPVLVERLTQVMSNML